MFMEAWRLFAVARMSYERIPNDIPEQEYNQTNAMIAVVFSALSLEAFINEVFSLAALPGNEQSPLAPFPVTALGGIANEISGASIKLKFIVAKSILTGQSYDRISQLFADFSLLIDVRNEVVHLKPFESNNSVRGIIKKLKKTNLLSSAYDPSRPTSLLMLISTRAAARWACNVTAEMVQSLIEAAPESQFRNNLKLSYGTNMFPKVN